MIPVIDIRTKNEVLLKPSKNTRDILTYIKRVQATFKEYNFKPFIVNYPKLITFLDKTVNILERLYNEYYNNVGKYRDELLTNFEYAIVLND